MKKPTTKNKPLAAMSKAAAADFWAKFHARLADTKRRLDNLQRTVAAGQARPVFVRETEVPAHTRAAHWRAYTPPQK